MARRHLEVGGAASTAHQRRDDRPVPVDFKLPPNVDPIVVAKAIEAKLGRSSHQSDGGQQVIKMIPDGQAIVPGGYVERLGGGDTDEGRGWINRVINDIRCRRTLKVNHDR